MPNIFSPGVSSILILVLIVVIVSLIVYVLMLNKKMKILQNNYSKFMKGTRGQDLEAVLLGCLNKIDKEEKENAEQNKKIENIYDRLVLCTQKLGFIRYNAFNNVGSDQSYSIALLDQNDSGVVISGIYGREHSTTYSKSVVNGESSYPLSEEEKKSIQMAKEGFVKNSR